MTNTSSRKIIWWTEPIVIGLCLVLGMTIGAATNVINVRVSAYYYMFMLGWGEEKLRVGVIFQGMLEGGVLGTLFGIVLAIAAAASTGMRCPVSLAVGMAFRVIPMALGCWVLGGIVGLSWARVAPASLRTMMESVTFAARSYAAHPPDLGGFAWVAGSIVGAYTSTVIGGVYAAVGLHLRWKRLIQKEEHGFEPLLVKA